MSLQWQIKCLSERLKDKFLKGQRMPFKFNDTISFNIDSRNQEAFASFSSAHPSDVKEISNFMALTKGKTCLLDIGAYYGIFSLVFTSNEPQRSAYAFDPSPRVFDFLKFNAKVNPQNKINVYQSVVGDNNDPVIMKFESINQLSAVGNKENVKKHKQNKIVESITIDQFVEENNIRPDVIKIDTEGFEYQVLKGGFNYIKTHSPLIFLEIHPPKLPNHGLSISKLKTLLQELGYKSIYDLDGTIIDDPEKYFDAKVAAYRTVVKK